MRLEHLIFRSLLGRAVHCEGGTAVAGDGDAEGAGCQLGVDPLLGDRRALVQVTALE